MIAQLKMTTEERNELDALKRAISDLPSSVAPHKMEKFTELFVRTLEGADDSNPLMRN
jgi:hypothetical protein